MLNTEFGMLSMGTRLVYTGGTFDIYHLGHVRLLAACRKIAGSGKVVVALNTDEFVADYKGKPPLNDYLTRYNVLSQSRNVDFVIPNSGGRDSKPAITRAFLLAQDAVNWTEKFIVIGADWALRDYYAQMDFTQDWLDERGIQLVYVPLYKGFSSTSLKERLAAGSASALPS